MKNNEETGFKYLNKNGERTLIVTFGGVNLGLGIPVFEFQKILNKYTADKVFIRDLDQAWYFKGIRGYSSTFEENVLFLKKLISDGKYERTIFIGNSAGAFAAILYGSLLKVDKILAFSPQSFMSLLKKMINRDFRWLKQMRNIYLSKTKSMQFLKLNSLKKTGDINVPIFLVYDQAHRLDNLHAKIIIKLFKEVKVFPYTFNTHLLVQTLKEKGELERILDLCILEDKNTNLSKRS